MHICILFNVDFFVMGRRLNHSLKMILYILMKKIFVHTVSLTLFYIKPVIGYLWKQSVSGLVKMSTFAHGLSLPWDYEFVYSVDQVNFITMAMSLIKGKGKWMGKI